ncbi:MAG TPA: hypothetical protein VM821_02995 [Abditibacteriaceae bacterium]|nr:hypothetical protein [Abditibacteriaceae bacterium]
MDKIDFVVSERHVNFFINNQNLIDMVREVELPFATAEGSSCIAGAYIGLPEKVALLPSEQLFGKPEEDFRDTDGRTCLLVCSACGESICWSLQAHVTLTETEGIWQSFRQPHRYHKSQTSIWKYEDFGPFRFSRQEYSEALHGKTSLD